MNYHNITKDDMLNGDGLRTVLWVSGCSHCCKGCQNPMTWDPNDGLLFDEAAKTEIFEQLEKDYIAGLTLSGGDPLHPLNYSGIKALIEEVKQKYPDKTIWLYTGSSWEDIMQDDILSNVDVLVDGEFIQELNDNNLMWKGSSNQRVIDVQKSLQQEDKTTPILFCGDYSKNEFILNDADKENVNLSCGVRRHGR